MPTLEQDDVNTLHSEAPTIRSRDPLTLTGMRRTRLPSRLARRPTSLPMQDCPSLACVAQRLAARLGAGCLPAFSDLDLVECRSEPLRKFLSVVVSPEVHEEEPGLVIE